MKRYISKIIVTILLAALCLPLNIVMSNAASKDAKNVRSAYASVLKKKKYLNNQGDSSKPSFALADLNGDGVSELIISSTDDFLSKKDYFMYKNGKAVKIKTPKSDFYPVFGALYEMPSRGTYVFYRGGPGFDGENGTLVMPYMYYEYKLSKGKIKLVNEFEKREITDRKNRKTNKITKNGKKCSGREFNNVQNSLENEIVFVANTKSNRQMKGVNTVIKKKKSTTKVPAKTLKEVSRLMKGKYDYYGQQGLYKVRYAKWKNDHFVWYCDGKKSNDDKVYKIKKVNAKKYIFYFKKHGKYRYEAVVKNGKITELTYYLAWKGNDISTSSSLGLLEN